MYPGKAKEFFAFPFFIGKVAGSSQKWQNMQGKGAQ
jgi:hypothetical protein